MTEARLRTSKLLYAAFALSGFAGLVYEVLWTRYLGLFVGHGAYAQVLVLAVYLGGMAVGAALVGDAVGRIPRPLRAYAAAEATLAVFGLGFHWLYGAASDLSYDVLFPLAGNAGLVGSIRWGVAGLLILPQAMILGATFPLMAASLVRADASRPGRGVARVYLLNTLGGAAGVLAAGFWMIGAFGLAGTSTAAAVLNLAAGGLALRATGRRGEVGHEPAPEPPTAETERDEAPVHWAARAPKLGRLLLVVSFGTAVASFAYEIGWIRMLSLVLGSATHSFELMLSAFILGLAGGAWWIADRSDRTRDPLRLLGVVQVLMGLTALLSVPLFYVASFDAMSWLVRTLPGVTGGYALFNLGRYGLSLLVMLPATLLAGMTLPLITGSLLRMGSGERAIGRVYALNTVGSVVGAGSAALVALPWLGVKALVVTGAALDVLLGLWLLARSARRAGGAPRLLLASALASVVLFVWVGVGVKLDEVVMGSGVFREGRLPEEGELVGLYYADGRTATVSAHLGTSDGVIVLATNGKPDASLDPIWLAERRDTLPDRPVRVGSDMTTQILAPAVALAHRPAARNVANIGHGSGMSATAFLTSAQLERVVTIEIEPYMVQGSMVFLPANGPALFDPRSSYVFDDAKSYFSYTSERFDIVFAEPSNPWVSGTASLFTEEFYRRITDSMAEGAILAQWMQLYELTDDLLLSVIAALDAVFPSYRGYLIGDSDVAIVARADGPLHEPDWSVLASDGFLQLAEGVPPFLPEHMQSLLLFDETTFRPLLHGDVVPNSDFLPVLDLGAERARFEQTSAAGAYSFATSRVDLARMLRDELQPPLPHRPVPSYGLAPMVLWGRAAWLRESLASGGGVAPEAFPDWQQSLLDLQTFLTVSRADVRRESWLPWAYGFDRAEADLHWGTYGWVDTTFYRVAYALLERGDAPPAARAAVDLRHGFALRDWERVASAADVLVTRVAAGEPWCRPEILVDMAVVAYLRTDRPSAARTALDRLWPATGRGPDHLRMRLLDALVRYADAAAPGDSG